jgi:hypothetical protein
LLLAAAELLIFLIFCFFILPRRHTATEEGTAKIKKRIRERRTAASVQKNESESDGRQRVCAQRKLVRTMNAIGLGSLLG